MLKIKICGITNKKDALDAVNLGTDFLGFHFLKNSSKKVSLKLASEIISKLPPFISPIGVFENEEQENILKTIKKCNLKFIQLNGQESPDFCKNLRSQYDGLKILKFFKIIKDENLVASQIENLKTFIDAVDYFVFDISYADGESQIDDVSQTAAVLPSEDNQKTQSESCLPAPDIKFYFEIIPQISEIGVPFFIVCNSGIETAIEEIVEKTSPFGLDADIILDRLPSRKEYEKIKKFMKTARLF